VLHQDYLRSQRAWHTRPVVFALWTSGRLTYTGPLTPQIPWQRAGQAFAEPTGGDPSILCRGYTAGTSTMQLNIRSGDDASRSHRGRLRFSDDDAGRPQAADRRQMGFTQALTAKKVYSHWVSSE